MKKILLTSTVLVTLLSAVSFSTRAQTGIPTPLIGNYAQQRNDADFHKYIDGGFDGLGVYNVVVQQQGQQKPAFCLPEGVDTSVKLALETIDGFVQANPITSDADKKVPTLLVLYFALASKYPCK